MAIVERALCPVLIGREEPLTLLEDALLSARRGEGSVVALAGEAGVGKTRLATELTDQAGRIGVQVMNGGCTEADLALPYLPFLEALGNFIAGSDVQILRDNLGPARDELAQLFPQLGAAAAGPTGMEGGKLRLFEAILALLQIAAGDSGLLLIVEDLHWADASTRELLDYLTRRVKQVPIMVLVTYRRDEMHRKHPLAPVIQGWKRSHLAIVVDLHPLDVQGVEDMVRAILDEREVSNEFRDFLHQRTEGNPFVLEEMLKEAIDRGDVYRTETGWDRKSIEEIGIPPTVSDNIMLRVERLDPDQADLLRAAAVLGRSFAYDTLREMTGAEEREIQAAVEAFVRQQLVEDDPHTKDRYWFRHALTREAIYDDLILPRRQQLHSRAAEVLQRVDAPAAEIAGHLLQAGATAEAVPLLMKAAHEAFERSGYEESIALYERAIPHLEGIDRARALCRTGEVMWSARGPGSAVKYLEDGIADLEARGEGVEAAHFRLILGRCYWERGDHVLAMAEYERVRETLEPEGPSADLALSYLRLSAMHSFQFELDQARPLAEKAIAIAERAGAEGIRIWGYNALGLSLYMKDIDEAIALIDRAFDEALERNLFVIAENALHNGVVFRIDAGRVLENKARAEKYTLLPPGVMRDQSRAFALGVYHHLTGELAESLEEFRSGAQRARGAGMGRIAELLECSWGLMLTEMGRYDEAKRLVPSLDPGLEVQDRVANAWMALLHARAAGDREFQERCVSVFRELHATAASWSVMFDDVIAGFIELGAVDDAAGLIDEAIGSGIVDFLSWVASARVALARGDAQRALDLATAGIAKLEETGHVLLALSGKAVLARALGAAGRTEEAVAVLNDAHRSAVEKGRVYRDNDVVAAARELDVMLDEIAIDDAPTADTMLPVGERLVSVLFADVRGYTSMTNQRVPAEIAADIAKLQRWAAAEVERHRGIVDKFAGDAVMATFNVSGMSVDHAVHALQTAVAIQDKAALAGLPVGAGIAVGPAIVGQLAGAANVSVLGETTNLAARLQAKAETGEIVLSEDAYRRCKDWLGERKAEVRREDFELKGFDDGPVAAFVIRAGVREPR
jgi:class 3 adenylate cyclase/tetratricopeptide (TPR) repeat protein